MNLKQFKEQLKDLILNDEHNIIEYLEDIDLFKGITISQELDQTNDEISNNIIIQLEEGLYSLFLEGTSDRKGRYAFEGYNTIKLTPVKEKEVKKIIYSPVSISEHLEEFIYN